MDILSTKEPRQKATWKALGNAECYISRRGQGAGGEE